MITKTNKVRILFRISRSTRLIQSRGCQAKGRNSYPKIGLYWQATSSSLLAEAAKHHESSRNELASREKHASAYQEDPAPVAAEPEQVERPLQRVGERRQRPLPLLLPVRGAPERLPELLGEGPEEPNPARQRQQLPPVRVPELPAARRRRLHGRRRPLRGGPAVAGHGVAWRGDRLRREPGGTRRG
jgi:hypothetical protein